MSKINWNALFVAGITASIILIVGMVLALFMLAAIIIGAITYWWVYYTIMFVVLGVLTFWLYRVEVRGSDNE